MALNEKPCGECFHFDQLLIGDGTKKARHGWCAVRSVYPAEEHEGQLFPLGVKRVKHGELAKPVIVAKDETVSHCTQFRDKPRVISTDPPKPKPSPREQQRRR